MKPPFDTLACWLVACVIFFGSLYAANHAPAGPAPAGPAPATPSVWYIEVLRGGEHVTSFLSNDKPITDSGITEFTTTDGVDITTTAPILAKKRPQ
jgi:hypothetical protein